MHAFYSFSFGRFSFPPLSWESPLLCAIVHLFLVRRIRLPSSVTSDTVDGGSDVCSYEAAGLKKDMTASEEQKKKTERGKKKDKGVASQRRLEPRECPDQIRVPLSSASASTPRFILFYFFSTFFPTFERCFRDARRVVGPTPRSQLFVRCNVVAALLACDVSQGERK
ncbi:hypothetical protein HPB51_011328 [Rhipicephalus microplus]|uniref:Uncharacterized protein n=1 Tax=Rhipicephalus microplus TaxID=6941 RepID=A0A9J6DMI9_RHIMP|nr:hypothetical protein HPB51_011328 [Rhipicephalus microplus]